MIKTAALFAITLFSGMLDLDSHNSAGNNVGASKAPLTVVLATSPKEEPWKDDLTKESTIEDIKKIAFAHDCSVIVDGELVYVVDEAAFGLKRLKTELSVFSEIAKQGIEPFLNIQEGTVSPITYNYLLQRHIDSPRFKDCYEKGQVKLFFSPSPRITLSANGVNKEVELPANVSNERRSELTNNIPSPNDKAQRQLPKLDRSLFEVGQGLKSIAIKFGGKERSTYNKAVLTGRIMKSISDSLLREENRVHDAATSLLNSLTKSQLESIWSSAANEGSRMGKYDDLSEETKRSLEANFSHNYRELGFASEQEALTFLRGSRIHDIRFNLGISFSVLKDGTNIEYRSVIDLDSR